VCAYAVGATLPEYLPKTDGQYLIASSGSTNVIEGNTAKVITLNLDLGSNLQKDSNSIIIAINVPCDNTSVATYKISAVKFYN
jgi:hypothetical protein